MGENKLDMKKVIKRTGVLVAAVSVIAVIFAMTESFTPRPDGIPQGSKEVVMFDNFVNEEGFELGNTHIYSTSLERIEELEKLYNEDLEKDKEMAIEYDKELERLRTSEDPEDREKQPAIPKIITTFVGDPDNKKNSVGYVLIDDIKEYKIFEVTYEDGNLSHYVLNAMDINDNIIAKGWDIPVR